MLYHVEVVVLCERSFITLSPLITGSGPYSVRRAIRETKKEEFFLAQSALKIETDELSHARFDRVQRTG